MDHHLDLRLFPDPEIAEAHLLNALADKLHLVLAELKSEDIGVCFPRFRIDPPGLGNMVRLHSSRTSLTQLMSHAWLTGMRDHVEVGDIMPVPSSTGYRTVRRVQAKSSAERVRRRQMKRHGWTAQEAQELVPEAVARRLNLPFLNLRSRSTGQPFRLFIEQCPAQSPTEGIFNAYGLSQSATIPWF